MSSNSESNDGYVGSIINLSEGTKVAHYRILKKIGVGGMGVVYLAEDSKLKRQVALKFLALDSNNDQNLKQQFIIEAQAAARLQHINIITVHEVNEYENIPYIAMEYIEGQTLDIYTKSNNISISEIIEIGTQVSSGLTIAHEKGITHRDLKPGNIIRDKNGNIKILDFGLAVLTNVNPINNDATTAISNPLSDSIAGTVSYMAPEQLLGQEIDSRVDIFSLGIILYEILTGENPYAAATVSETSAKILRDTPDKLPLSLKNIPYDLERIIFRCLNKNRDKRFQTIKDVLNELEDLSSLLKQNIDVSIGNQKVAESTVRISEESFVLSTDLIRNLSHKDSKMIGSKLAYIDNGVSSDEIIFYLHGIGNDHRQFTNVLRQLPFRAIAISVFGFDQHAQHRQALILNDHSIIIQATIGNICNQLRPKKIFLSGYSSGADHFLHMVTSGLFDKMNISGLLSLGCNIYIEDCFVTGKLASLTAGDEQQILSTIKEFGKLPFSLNNWLIVHAYLVAAFSKFGTDVTSLRKYSSDIMAPFLDNDSDQFPAWYKSCIKKIPNLQFLFDTDSNPTLDRVLSHHLESNVLGDDFNENTISRAPISHMELGQTEMFLKYTLEFMNKMNN